MNHSPIKLFLCSVLLSTGVVAETQVDTTDTTSAPASAPAPIAESSANNEIYIGIDAFISDNTFTTEIGNNSIDNDNDSNGVKLKIGTRFAETWRVQAYLQFESYDDPVYGGKNNKLGELGADVIKAFPTSTNFSPFIQLGVGLGSMKLDGAAVSDSSANEISIKIGGGAFYKFNASFEGVAGIDLQGRNWSDIEILGTTIERSEGSLRYYIGANYFF